MTRATILPAVDPPSLAGRYEQASRVVSVYVRQRHALSIAVLGTGSPARMLDMLEIARANAVQALHDLAGDFRLPFATMMRLLVWANKMRECDTTAEGDEETANSLHALASEATKRDTQPCAEVRA